MEVQWRHVNLENDGAVCIYVELSVYTKALSNVIQFVEGMLPAFFQVVSSKLAPKDSTLDISRPFSSSSFADAGSHSQAIPRYFDNSNVVSNIRSYHLLHLFHRRQVWQPAVSQQYRLKV